MIGSHGKQAFPPGARTTIPNRWCARALVMRGGWLVANGFDADRFREAVLYVAWLTREDARFGRTKLAKTLFYADFSSYAEDGRALTGARYHHWPRGPFPPALYGVQDELVASGTATVKEPQFQGDEAKLIPTDAPLTPHLTEQELVFLEIHAQKIAEDPTWKVSDVSHEHPAWALTADREEIPYAAALVPRSPSDRVRELARRRFHGEGRTGPS
jgi:Protein of unknown function (DUF4065)